MGSKEDRFPAVEAIADHATGPVPNRAVAVWPRRTDLTSKAVPDTAEYEAGANVSAVEIKGLNLRRHEVHPKWNWTLSPRALH
jgi:hypothetical protein